MSRRPNPAADRAEQNRQTLKSLVKLDANKSCADCKRNKHPRWASWNLGIFICIRCSGIHRGMGTHISRVKSVDLDSWTDEQLQSMLKWGNARANKYWEAKLAPGHVPSEAKIENFIRTKYESKRWVMDGPMPDPSTLDVDGDDDTPLSIVQEKVKIERSASQRAPSAPTRASTAAPPKQQPAIDLFGDPAPAPARPSTGPPVSRAVPQKSEPAPPKQTKAGDSLLGLDFLGGGQSTPPARPASTSTTSSAPSRPDLKQSILSLYASAPKPAPQPQPQHGHTDSFGNLASPGLGQQQQQSAFGGLNDAFSSLSFNSQPAQQQQQHKPSPFAGLDSFSSTRSPPAQTTASPFGGGGSFFDTTSKPAQPQAQKQQTTSSLGDFGDFSTFSPPASSTTPATTTSSSGFNDLLDLSMPSTTPAPATKSPSVTSPSMSSAFNLASPVAAPKPTPAGPPAPVNYSGFSNMDAWGSSDAWASSVPGQSTSTTTATTSHTQASPGWGQQSTTQVTQDDDWGGWSSAAPSAPTTTTTSTTQKPNGGFGGDDLFSNVWE
ncbi:ArfGap-domain-containing protein [Delitschia confertaspora ATCC 74209]|uniref:ArfGap-domain-containing protein n=1 Tax=Delitschia confertaspora ATCC 74209 TaxID=1513339 RepID=A0A9P4JPR1_9PLEO|nr:ArfGap-domain-containing protein [Delitschia confertaspora ATCC 74209]